MSDDEIRRAQLAGLEAMSGIEPMLDTLDGMVAATKRRGFTEEQARGIVAWLFGYRLTDGTTPDGTQ
jgi:hypothetical protein